MRKIGLTRKVSLTLEEAVWERLEVYCFMNDCSMSKAIRDMMLLEQVQERLSQFEEISWKMGEGNDE